MVLGSVVITPGQTFTAVQFTVSEADTTVYYLIQIGGFVPSNAQIKTGVGNGGLVQSSGSATPVGVLYNFDVTGLTTDTRYSLYMLLEDTAGNHTLTASALLTTSVPPDPTVQTLNVSPSQRSFAALGDTRQLFVEAIDSLGNPQPIDHISWSTSNSEIVSVSDGGLLRSEGNGEATISLVAHVSGSTYQRDVDFSVTQEPVTLNLNWDTISLSGIGDTVRISADPHDSNGNEIEYTGIHWTSSNQDIAELAFPAPASATGNWITARDFGNAIITATFGAATDQIDVDVEIPDEYPLLPSDWEMSAGSTVRFVHKLNGNHQSDVKWTVNGIEGGDSEVGTIDAKGNYLAPENIPIINPVVVEVALVSNPAVNAQSHVTITDSTETLSIDWHQFSPAAVRDTHPDIVRLEAAVSGSTSPYPTAKNGLGFQLPYRVPPTGERILIESVPFSTGIHAWFFTLDQWSRRPEGEPPGVGGTVVFNCAGVACGGFSLSSYLSVFDSNLPPTSIIGYADDVQASGHVINIAVEDHRDYQSFSVGLNSSDLAKKVYQYFPDDFDFLWRIGAVDSRTGSASAPHFVNVSNSVEGIGLPIFDATDAYGSGGRLKGIINFDDRGPGPSGGWVLLHEISHNWLAYLGEPPIMADSHWPRYTNLDRGNLNTKLTKTVDYEFNVLGGDLFEVVCLSKEEWPPIEFSFMELYLMGLVLPTQVPSYVVLDNQTPRDNCGSHEPGEIVTVNGVVNTYGERIPGHQTSQKDFTMATIVLSLGRLLNEDEMAYYEFLSSQNTSLAANGTGALRFFEATKGLGTLSTRVLP